MSERWATDISTERITAALAASRSQMASYDMNAAMGAATTGVAAADRGACSTMASFAWWCSA
jgi:hypothetical protein